MRRYALRDDQWDRIKDLLPGREGCVGVTAKDNRLFVEAVLYRYRAGIPWRDLPERFGDWKKVHTRFCRWAKTGVWERIFRHLAGEADNEYAMIDSTVVRAHQHSAGAVKRRRRRGDRAQQRRPEHEDPRPGRRARQPDRVRALAGAGARPGGGRRAAARPRRRRADRRQGVRRRGARAPASRTGRQDGRDPARGQPQGGPGLRQGPLQGAPPDRELLRQAEAVPGDRDPLRQAGGPLPRRHPPRRSRRLAQLRTRPRWRNPMYALPITRAEDFPAWYQAVVREADMAEASPVRGCMVIKPWGYGIWELMQRQLDARIKELGFENCYFPIFIPMSFFSKEAEHVEGFAKEMAVVTHHRLRTVGRKLEIDPDSKLDEPLIVRPTSETIIGDSFHRWVQSYRDLPLRINQWANIVRWEMRTRLFLRTAEFLWQEGHSAHADEKEARESTMYALELYREFSETVLAIPTLAGEKPENERFPGAD